MGCDMIKFVLIFLIYPKRTFGRITAVSWLSMNNYTVLLDEVTC